MERCPLGIPCKAFVGLRRGLHSSAKCTARVRIQQVRNGSGTDDSRTPAPPFCALPTSWDSRLVRLVLLGRLKFALGVRGASERLKGAAQVVVRLGEPRLEL